MINILLEGFDIDAPWLYDELKNYIKPNLSVAVVAFSFKRQSCKIVVRLERLCMLKDAANITTELLAVLRRMVSPKNVSFINYFY